MPVRNRSSFGPWASQPGPKFIDMSLELSGALKKVNMLKIIVSDTDALRALLKPDCGR